MRYLTVTTFAALAAFAVISAPALAAPVTWDFGGSGGNMSVSEEFTSGFESLTATAINTENETSHQNPRIHQTAGGLGVNIGHAGPNDNHQIDNRGDDEAIVFDFGSLYSVSSIGITAANILFVFPSDSFEIYGTNNASVLLCKTTGLSCLTGVSTFITSGTGNGTYGLSGVYRYIVATVPSGNGDDYRVGSLTAMAVSAVPLPAAMPLFATGLAVLGFAAHRRRRRKVAPS